MNTSNADSVRGHVYFDDSMSVLREVDHFIVYDQLARKLTFVGRSPSSNYFVLFFLKDACHYELYTGKPGNVAPTEIKQSSALWGEEHHHYRTNGKEGHLFLGNDRPNTQIFEHMNRSDLKEIGHLVCEYDGVAEPIHEFTWDVYDELKRRHNEAIRSQFGLIDIFYPSK